MTIKHTDIEINPVSDEPTNGRGLRKIIAALPMLTDPGKIHDLHRMLNSGGDKNCDDDLDTKEKTVTSVVKKHYPSLQMFLLFGRWARKVKFHFNTDSIHLLNCIANQCKFTSEQLLNVKHINFTLG